jgi:hypothetical protein
MSSTTNEPSQESRIIARRDVFTTDDLRAITSFDDLKAVMVAQGIKPTNIADVLGDGFELLPTDQKFTLQGEPFAIVSWTFTDGDNGEFVSARVITKTNRKLILNDGSKGGIRDQLRDIHEKGHLPPVWVPKGLRVSDYEYEDNDGKKRKAQSYYLNLSA